MPIIDFFIPGCLKKEAGWRLAVFVCALLMSSCHPGKTTITIGFSQCTGEDGWRRSQLEEMKRELAFHPSVRFIYKDARESNTRQIAQIRELLRQHIDVLIVSPNEARPLTPIVNEVYRKGIPVIVVDRKTNSDQYSAYVGADNEKIGFLAGAYIGRLLKGKGKIVEIQGLPGSTPASERHRGFIRGIRDYPGIRIIREVYADWTGPTAARQLERVKDSVMGADLVFAQNDVMAEAAHRVFGLWDGQVKTRFIGVDASPGPNLGLSWIAHGILTASVLYPTGGKEAIRAAIAAARGERLKKQIILNTLVIDSSNVGLMKLQTDKILSQQNDIERQQRLLDAQLKIYKNQRNILYILLATLIIALVLGSFLYVTFRKNKRITQSLKLKNKEIVFQQNKLIEYANHAKEATEAKLNFFTNISHEFRTPLTLIFGAIDELSENSRLQETFRGQLSLVRRNATRLLRMVNQLIDYRKTEVNKMKVHAAEADIIPFVEEIVESFRTIARKRNIDLRFSHPDHTLITWFDPYMIDKVFFNLLSNAFKFTEDYGRIDIFIGYSPDGRSIVAEVDDNGNGVPPEEAEKIFEVFFQGKNSYNKGFGLGLPLAREFVRLHYGNLSCVRKETPGAKFRIVLPVGKAHFAPHELQAASMILQPERETFYNEPSEDSGSLEGVPGTPHELSLLIIEDNPDLLNFLRDRFEKTFEVHTAVNGEAGLKKAFEVVPDLIICDIVMPLKDGITITRMMKSNIRTSHIPVILLTARGNSEQQIEGIRAMADYYIVKPFDLRFLHVVADTLIRSREQLKAHYSLDCNLDINHDGPGRLDRRFLNELNAFIDENIADEKLNIERICRQIGISRVQLYRKVKALLGCSVNDFILNKRLTKARHMLADEDATIAEVAYEVGFSSPSYFSTAFKRRFGLSPKEIRKQQFE
jgi:signal transduction histidine kinase/AraC-like DNA-binding protein